MLIKKASDIKGSDITDYHTYLERRQFLRGASISVLAAGITGLGAGLFVPSAPAHAGAKLEGVRKSPLSTDEMLTPYKDVTQYKRLLPRPWRSGSPSRTEAVSRRCAVRS